tara:strand:+ start:65 stop:1015 length:951 start_codon:yes stop_codon:yes gene_type:complete
MRVLLIGCGYMAQEYAKVLQGLKIKFDVIGKSSRNYIKFKELFPVKVYSGGLKKFLEKNELTQYSHIINSVNINSLNHTTITLLNNGAKKILLEKPGDISVKSLKKINNLSNKKDANILIAYNRRFYSSIEELKKLSKKDGGIISVHFEFTEWIHTIKHSDYDKEILKKWIIANSSHVIDTVFYLIGNPKNIHSTVSGKSKIDWHPSGSIFTGSGISIKNIPFTYHANWLSSGRWGIEILTNKRRFYLQPMEILQDQKISSIKINKVKINNNIDKKYKPGLYEQVSNFTNNNFGNFCTIEDQIIKIKNIYNKIGNY